MTADHEDTAASTEPEREKEPVEVLLLWHGTASVARLGDDLNVRGSFLYGRLRCDDRTISRKAVDGEVRALMRDLARTVAADETHLQQTIDAAITALQGAGVTVTEDTE